MSLSKSYNSDFKLVSKLVTFLILFLSFGYPIIPFISELFNIQSRQISIFYRVILFIISFLLIFKSIKKNIFNNIGSLLLIFFLTLYSVRLIIDLQIIDINLPTEYTDIYFYSFFFGNSFFPVLAVLLSSSKIDINDFNKKMFSFLLIMSLLVLFLLFYRLGFGTFDLNERQSIISISNTDVLNSITISKFGIYLIYSSLIYYFTNQSKYYSFYLPFLIVIGLLIIFVGGSRGPFLTIVYTPFLLFDRNFIFKKYVFLIMVFLFSLFIFYFLSVENISVINRILDFDINSESEVRTKLYENSINQFLSSPIFGDTIIEREFQSYPHNILLEILMSLGLIGIILFIPILFHLLRIFLISISRKNYLHYNVVFFNIILFQMYMTSGSIFEASDFWIFTSLNFSIIKNNFG